jgi:hypothetical protein
MHQKMMHQGFTKHLHKQFSHSTLVIYQGMLSLSSSYAQYGPEEDELHHTGIYQAVAQHIIITQCISAQFLLLLLLFHITWLATGII